MNIAVYIKDIIYKFGGTESYTANLVESLQKTLNYPNITILTEYYKNTSLFSEDKLINTLNEAYGVEITTKNLKIKYIKSKEIKNRIDSFKFQSNINKNTKDFDAFFYCSKGLLTGNAKKNIAIIHFPMEKKETFPTYQKFPFLKFIAKHTDNNYLKKYDYFIPNSNFTKYWLQQKWNINDDKIKVLYPPVTMISTTKEKQQENILICSRIEKSKKIEELIKAYSKSDFLSKNSKLIIAGSTKNESPEYVQYLQNINNSVKFIFDPSRKEIEELYASSYIFWHAKGFEETDPYQMEHFGITTVEAMSAKCIPIVINKGGQTEIVTDKCGFKWDNLEELVKYTEYIYSDKIDINSMQQNSFERSKLYSKETFQKQLSNFLKEFDNKED